MFPNKVNTNQAPGVEGDFASTNPFANVLGGPGALVAPAGGLRVGRFAWVGPTGQVSQSYVAGYQIGFLGRNMQGLITAFLGENTLIVPEGFMVTLFNEGDFWARFPAGAIVGNNVYADPDNGTPLAGASAPTLAAGTGSAGFTGDGTLVTGTSTLTITTATNGVISPGDSVSGTDIPSGTKIVAQLTVTSGSGPGLLGTYEMSANATATVSSPEAITVTSPQLYVTAIASGAFTFGDVITATGIPGGTSITGQATPFSGVASLATNTSLTVTSVTPGTDLLRVGATVTGVGIPASTTIASQTSGTPGGVGVYVLSAASTATAAGVAITTTDSAGGTGLYSLSSGPIASGTASLPGSVTTPGTAQPTPFKVRGIYSPLAGEIGKISTN